MDHQTIHLLHLEFVFEFGEEFDVEVPDDVVNEIVTVGDALAQLETLPGAA